MNIREATTQDIDAITQIYDHIHDEEEAGRMTTGWHRGIYPIRATAETAVSLGDMFVLEDGGNLLAAGRINQQQVAEYARIKWLYDSPDDKIWGSSTLWLWSLPRKEKAMPAPFWNSTRITRWSAAAMFCA